MATKDIVLEWLDKHRGYQFEKPSKEEFAHFVNIVTDIADYCVKLNSNKAYDYMGEYIAKKGVSCEEWCDTINGLKKALEE